MRTNKGGSGVQRKIVYVEVGRGGGGRGGGHGVWSIAGGSAREKVGRGQYTERRVQGCSLQGHTLKSKTSDLLLLGFKGGGGGGGAHRWVRVRHANYVIN